MLRRKFSKETLDAILEDISNEYFAEDNQLGFWEIVEYVKGLYADEINTLDDKTTIARREKGVKHTVR